MFHIRRPGYPGSTSRASMSRCIKLLLNKVVLRRALRLPFVRPAKWLGDLLWKGGDGRLIDGLGPTASRRASLDATARAVRLQTGYVYHYAFAMLIGVAALVTWFIVRREVA